MGFFFFLRNDIEHHGREKGPLLSRVKVYGDTGCYLANAKANKNKKANVGLRAGRVVGDGGSS